MHIETPQTLADGSKNNFDEDGRAKRTGIYIYIDNFYDNYDNE